jgi:TP901 family phage tail tape measure protein
MAGDQELLLRIGADIRQWEAGLRRTETGASKLKTRIAGMYRNVTQGLSRAIANPLTAVLGGAAILKATHDLAQYDSKLTRLAIQGRMSAEEQNGLRKSIYDVSIATGQSREDILGGLDAIVQRTGNLQFATGVMEDMAIASTATGAAMGDLGALASNLQEKMGLATDEIRTAFGILTSQGKAGAFTLENMATMGERLFAAAGRFGVKGMSGIKEFGALIQTARIGTGSSEQATTAIEGAMADIIDKAEMLKAGGFSIFKPGTKNEIKSVSEVFKGIIKMTGGDVTKMQKIFGRESIRGVTAIANMYKETGGFALFDKLMEGGDPAELMKDFSRYAQSSAFQFNVLKGIATEFADSALSPVLAEISGKIRELTSDPAKMEEMRTKMREFGEAVGDLAKALGPLADALVAAADGWARIVGAISDDDHLLGILRSQKEVLENTKQFGNDAMFDSLPVEERKRIGKRNLTENGYNMMEDVYRTALRLKMEQPKNEIHITQEIRQDGTVSTTVDSANATVDTKTRRGDTGHVPQ